VYEEINVPVTGWAVSELLEDEGEIMAQICRSRVGEEATEEEAEFGAAPNKIDISSFRDRAVEKLIRGVDEPTLIEPTMLRWGTLTYRTEAPEKKREHRTPVALV
jgi:hypothetical protein